ncbi:MAG: hypothetical protein Q8R28_15030 [Dehalococcoidia bacterium]|nr:hypothetical protein [Dehalococcoidia bacterium]
MYFGKLGYDGVYRLPRFGQTAEGISQAGDLFETWYAQHKQGVKAGILEEGG